MKIVLAHNTYQWPGGEDVIVEQERELLCSAGHQVIEYRRSNHEAVSGSLLRQISLARHAIWASDSYEDFRLLLRRERPDVVHVHNTFVMISPSIYWACAEENVPVVQTLHNYRLFCPQGMFLRDGKICEECAEHTLLRSFAYGCYHGSRLATGASALVLATHRWAGTWAEKIDCYIAVSEFARKKFVQAGLPAEKLTVKPHFVYPDPGPRTAAGSYALFVGRFTSEKGLPTLLDAWERVQSPVPLVLIGDGPLRSSLEERAARLGGSSVIFRGHLTRKETLQAMRASQFLLCASECYEQGPATILEAFSCGVPVIAPALGPIGEVVDDRRSGLLFRAGDSAHLADRIQWALDHQSAMQTMGLHARGKYEAAYTAERNYDRLMEIYERVLSKRASSGRLAIPMDPSCVRSQGIASV